MFISKDDYGKLKQCVLVLCSVIEQLDEDEQEAEGIRRFNLMRLLQAAPPPAVNKEVIEEENFISGKSSLLKFTEKEISRMPKEFRKQFRVGKITAHVRRFSCGVYEVGCQIKKTRIYVSSKSLAIAKEKFTKKLIEFAASIAREQHELLHEPVKQEAIAKANPITLAEYMTKWMETVKKVSVKELSYKAYCNYCKNNIYPALGNKPMSDIKAIEVQSLLNKIVISGKMACARQCCLLLKSVFEYAVIDDVITKSPMLKVKVPHFENAAGVPLTLDEEKKLVGYLLDGGNIYAQLYVFMLYTGLRRSELASVQVKDGWVFIVSAKNKKGYREKTRAMPLCPMLTPLLKYIDLEAIKQIKPPRITQHIKDFFPNHHSHELRHTFITRAQECGCRREIVSIWAGHTSDGSITTVVYTHLDSNKELMLKEMSKFKYEL